MSGMSTDARRRFDGKVVFISGIGRGQGRQHAVDFATEGADVIGFDICEDVPTAHQPMATKDDLAETVRLVESAGGRIVATQADVRDHDAVHRALDAGLAEFGRVDVVVANAGMAGDMRPLWEVTEEGWRDVIDTNLTGVFHTVKAAAPPMIAAGNGGSMVLIGSIAAGKGWANLANYVSAKHGLVGLMRVMAIELAPHGIRANVVSPTNVGTRMFMNDVVAKVFAPELESPSMEEFERAARWMNLLPRGWIEPEDISSAVRWISSAEARYVTGHMLPVDAGCLAK
jgi:(+)-trans-carveol dehydrogenase